MLFLIEKTISKAFFLVNLFKFVRIESDRPGLFRVTPKDQIVKGLVLDCNLSKKAKNPTKKR